MRPRACTDTLTPCAGPLPRLPAIPRIRAALVSCPFATMRFFACCFAFQLPFGHPTCADCAPPKVAPAMVRQRPMPCDAMSPAPPRIAARAESRDRRQRQVAPQHPTLASVIVILMISGSSAIRSLFLTTTTVAIDFDKYSWVNLMDSTTLERWSYLN